VTKRELEILPAGHRGLALALDWAAEEGWNPGLNDARCFYAADSTGFFIAELGDEPVGFISSVAYGPAFGFLGLYLVRPDFRARGIGLRLWQHASDYLGHRAVGLDGVPAQQANYEKSGFRGYHGNIRFRVSGGSGSDPSSAEIIDIEAVSFEDVAAFDRKVFGAPREGFLREWLTQRGAASLAALEDGQLAGYGVLRPCRVGFKIGPLFAREDPVAEALFDALVTRAEGERVYIDVPEANAAAMAFAQKRGLEPVFHTARMYKGRAPAPDVYPVFGVTSLELG